MTRFRIAFQIFCKRGEFESKSTILDAAKSLGIPLDSLCGGEGRCSRCKVLIEKGRSNLSPITTDEKRLLSKTELSANYRLACQAEIHGDVVISVPETSIARIQVFRKPLLEIPTKLEPALKKYHVKVPSPTLETPVGDAERLLEVLDEQYGLKDVGMDFHVLRGLPESLRKREEKATATVWCGKKIIRVESGRHDKLYGVAIDIGTTTIVGYLFNLVTGKLEAFHSLMNPQVSFGDDVMSRISFAMNDTAGLDKLHRSTILGINIIVENLAKQANITTSDILETVFVGNTCMHHLLLKLDPRHLGYSPFSPVIHRSIDIKARELGINIFPAGNLHFLPIEARFVGADNVGGLIASQPWKSAKIQLIIDIGTNGEILLGNEKKLFSTSCAT